MIKAVNYRNRLPKHRREGWEVLKEDNAGNVLYVCKCKSNL